MSTDNAKMVAFYSDIFGFKTEWNGMEPNVEITLGASRIILFPRDAFEQMTSHEYAYPDGINGTMGLSFDVPTFADVDKEYDRTVSMGGEAYILPYDRALGTAHLLCGRP